MVHQTRGTSQTTPPFPPLYRNRDYLTLWSGQAISSVGNQVSRLAFPLLVLSITGSPAQAGLVSGVASIPYLLLALFAGSIADRSNRKVIMVIADTGRAIGLVTIPLADLFGGITIVQLYVVALIEGTLLVFFDLAEIGALPRVIASEQLPAAVSQNSATNALSSLIGQPLGGILFGLGRTVPFLADAVSYAASVISILLIRTPFQEEATAEPVPLREHIREGFHWIWDEPVIRFLAFLNAALWVAVAGNYLLIVVIARHQHASPFAIGLASAGLGAGGIVGALLVPVAQRRLGLARVVVGGMALSAVLWALYAVVPNTALLGIVAALATMVFSLYNSTQMSYRISMIPNNLQGRVNGLFRLTAFTGQPVGLALTGILLQTIGIDRTVSFDVVWLLMLAVIAALNRNVRRA